MESKPKYLERKNSSTTNTLEYLQEAETNSSIRLAENINNNTVSSRRIVEEVKELVDEEIKETPKNNNNATYARNNAYKPINEFKPYKPE